MEHLARRKRVTGKRITRKKERWLFAGLMVSVIPFLLAGQTAIAASLEVEPYVVEKSVIHDEKSVFASVESLKVIPARVRISGTVAEIRFSEGDSVASSQVIGNVGDEKLALQLLSLDSRLTGLTAQRSQARKDLKRMESLFPSGAIAQASLDAARTGFDVADNALKAATAERDVLRRQLSEGAVLSPVTGRILSVPLTPGAVVMPGEVFATVAEENFILRLEIPERHARYMKLGHPVRIDAPDMGEGVAPQGKIIKIYPRIENGRVYADARVDGLGNYFVGQRIRVWVPAGSRDGVVIPGAYLTTRGGVDYVRVESAGGEAFDVAVQRGKALGDGIEILSGLQIGDRIRAPLP